MRRLDRKLTKMATRSTPSITAGGHVDANTIHEVRVPDAGIRFNALALKTSPSVFSLCKRGMEEGCSFRWDAGQLPTLLSPWGERDIVRAQAHRPHVEFRSRMSCR